MSIDFPGIQLGPFPVFTIVPVRVGVGDARPEVAGGYPFREHYGWGGSVAGNWDFAAKPVWYSSVSFFGNRPPQ